MATTENGPSVMYKLKPFYSTTEAVPFPNCMYKLKSFFGDDQPVDEPSQTGLNLADLERRQEGILLRLKALSEEVDALVHQAPAVSTQHVSSQTTCNTSTATTVAAETLGGVIRDIVICASPSRPPLSALVLSHLLGQQYRVLHACHAHSTALDVTDKLKQAFGCNGGTLARSSYQLAITLIWKAVSHGPTLMVSPHKQSVIEGEACVARYLARLLSPSYEDNINQAGEIDTWLDLSHLLTEGSKKEKAAVLKNMNSKLGQSSWLVGNNLSLADIVLWSILQQNQEASSAPNNVKKWLVNCSNHAAFQSALKAL